jgi:Protein of unknown function (DUF2750)
MDVEIRISNRKNLSDKQINGLISANSDKRKKYFFSEIVSNHELWTVFDGQKLPTFKTSKNDALQVWPYKEFAEIFFDKSILHPKIVPIPIDDWIDLILFDPKERALDLTYFPVGPSTPSMMSSRESFLEDLLTEWYLRFGNHPQFEAADPGESIARLLKAGLKESMKSSPKGRIP